jgi:hypothetical protein
MRFVGRGSRSNKIATFWAAGCRSHLLLDLEGYLSVTRYLASLWDYNGNSGGSLPAGHGMSLPRDLH